MLKNKKELSFTENFEPKEPENIETIKNIENIENCKSAEKLKNDENLEKKINELENIIKDQEKSISEMSLSLGSSMKKKQPLSSLQIEKILQTFQY